MPDELPIGEPRSKYDDAVVREWLHPEIKKRRPDFEKLVSQLAEEHEIDERAELRRAVNSAMLIYHNDRGALPEDDVAQLMELAPRIAEILGRESPAS